jgi:hypothetical protein
MSTKKTIAKSFTVSTIEDGVSIQAQYAPNANPTSDQIHTVWQAGDLYMRTRESDDTAWSSWHKIVGESGDETDYTFNISQSLTSSSATTAPANCYYDTWQDAPVAPTSTYPYLWMKIVKKTWNESTQSYDSGTARYARVTGEPGTSPYFADLNNEIDAIQCKHDGSVITDQTVSTVISMWKGSSVEAFVIDNIYRNGTKLTWDGNNNGVWPRVNGSTVSLEFTTSASIADIDDFKITIHSYNDNTVTRELHFTINGVRANAIYRLIPSHSQIVKKKDGTYVPSGNVTCSVEKTENGSTSTPSSSEYTLEKSVNGGSYTTYSATAASSITSDLKFRLKVGGVVVDLETVPLVSDGNKGDTGDSAPAAFASPAQISIPCYSNGNVKAQKITSVIFSLKVGTHTATVTSCADGTKPTGVTVQGQANNAVTITVGTSATASGLSAGVTFTVTGTYDGKTYSATVTVALIGSTQGEQGDPGSPGGTGPRGKIGRFFYYAGEWDESNNTDTFVINDAQVPYFSKAGSSGDSYYVFNIEETPSGGVMSMAQMATETTVGGQIQWNNKPWELMTSDFKYIITEAIFANYAHFGSSIINADYLLSQYGYMRGFGNTKTPITDSTQYIYANPDDMFGEAEWDLTDENIIVNKYLNIEITNNDSYSKIESITAFEIKKGRWYTMLLTGYCDGDNNTHTLTVAIGTSSSNIITASEISVKGYNSKRSDGLYESYLTFKATENLSTCYMYVKNDSRDAFGLVHDIVMRYAQFVPTLCIDMKSGKLVANNIRARGELHADSFVYNMIYGNSNGDTITVNEESIINLGTGAESTIVKLPSPSTSKGRRIEIYNHSTSWEITWVGANSTSSLQAAYGSGLSYRTSYSLQLDYMLVYCDGTTWWCLKAE